MTFDVTPSITLVILAAVLVAVGIHLMLERSLTRIVIGLVIASNGVNVLFLVAGGRAGSPPLNEGVPWRTWPIRSRRRWCSPRSSSPSA